MSVATKNPFAILDAEDSSRPTSPSPATAKASSQPSSAPARAAKPRGGPASRGGKYYARGGAPRDSNQPPAEDPDIDNQRKTDAPRGRGRGRDRGGPARGGRRTFDRHSQTGKTDSDKKLHQGWGGDDGNSELKTEEAATVDAAAEAAPEDAAAGGAGESAEDRPEGGRPRKEREPEEEDSTLTLDQYLAQKKDKDANIPKIEGTRQANEGADGDLWKGTTPLSKNEEDDAYFIGKSKSTPKTRAKKEDKVYLTIDARFERPERSGRGRGRGGERGRGRGRDGVRDTRQNGGAPNVDDQTAFPSLS